MKSASKQSVPVVGKRAKTSSSPVVSAEVGNKTPGSTKVWGKAEGGDFLIVPRAFILFRRMTKDEPKFAKLKSHHLHLLMLLAAKQFKWKVIRAYWLYLGRDLGVEKDTVRKWAYQLEKMGLLKIERFRRRADTVNRPGYRNDQNTFNLSPLVGLVEKLYEERKTAKLKKRQLRAEEGES